MANGDVYDVVVVSESQGVPMANTFTIRATADAAPGQELTAILSLFEQEVVPKMQTFTVESTVYTCITARRRSAPSTANSIRFIDLQGSILGDAQPTTVYVKVRAYTVPYFQRQSLGLELQGVPDVDTKNGQINLGHILRFEPFINFMLSDPITFAGNSYLWVSSREYPPLDPPNPPIKKAVVVPCLYNSINRQTNLCQQ